MRTYSLFVKEGARWTRITPLAMSLQSARQLFQGYLLGGSLSGYAMALRPASEDFANQAKYDADRDRIFTKQN